MKTISIPKISLAGKGSSGSAPKKIKLPDGTKFANSTCSNFDWLKNVDTSEMTSMVDMFNNCTKAKSIDLSSFVTSAVTTMAGMFKYCSSIQSLDFSSFDTAELTNIGEMFAYSRIKSLDPSFLNTSKVTSMYGVFKYCPGLLSLDLSSFDTSSAINMGEMFRDCSYLKTLNLSSFNTVSVTNMSGMFNYCPRLSSLILGPNFFKTKSVTSIDFSTCNAWVGDTVVTSLVTNSYDRASAGLSVMTLKLHANTKAALTDEQKASITAKGYTIA